VVALVQGGMHPAFIAIPAGRLGPLPGANLEDPVLRSGAFQPLRELAPPATESRRPPEELRRPVLETSQQVALAWLRGEKVLDQPALSALCQIGKGFEEADGVVVVREASKAGVARDRLMRLCSGREAVREGPQMDLCALTGGLECLDLRSLVAGLRRLGIWSQAVIHPQPNDAVGIVWRLFYRDPSACVRASQEA